MLVSEATNFFNITEAGHINPFLAARVVRCKEAGSVLVYSKELSFCIERTFLHCLHQGKVRVPQSVLIMMILCFELRFPFWGHRVMRRGVVVNFHLPFIVSDGPNFIDFFEIVSALPLSMDY